MPAQLSCSQVPHPDSVAAAADQSLAASINVNVVDGTKMRMHAEFVRLCRCQRRQIPPLEASRIFTVNQWCTGGEMCICEGIIPEPQVAIGEVDVRHIIVQGLMLLARFGAHPFVGKFQSLDFPLLAVARDNPGGG